MELWKVSILLISGAIVFVAIIAGNFEKWIKTYFRVVGDANSETFDAIVQKISENGGILQVHYKESTSSINNVIIFDLYCFRWNRKKLIRKFKTISNVEVL